MIGALVVVAVLVVAALALRGGEAPSSHSDDSRRIAAVFAGDSYTEGTGAADRQGWTYQACRQLDWACTMDAEGGTGFLADGTANDPSYAPLADRLPSTVGSLADVVVVDAGRNDSAASSTELTAAVDGYLSAVRARWPDAALVLVAPFFLFSQGGPGSYEAEFADLLRDAAETYDAVVVDPLGEGWLDGVDVPAITSEDGVHPNQAGHDLIAERFVADMRELGIDRVDVTDDGT